MARSTVTFCTVIGLLAASAASAANFSLTADYRDKPGTIELPLAAGLGGVGPGIHEAPGATVSQMGAAVPGGGPATIVVPKSAITDVPTKVRGFLIPIPAIIQLTTSISHLGPTTTTSLKASGGPGSFAYCPGAAANPSCTTVVAGGSQGTVAGIVRYTAGPNQFGGTLKMLLKGVGNLVSKGAALPASTMTPMGATKAALPFSALNAPLGDGGSGAIALAGAGQSLRTTFIPAGLTGNRTHPYSYKATPAGLLNPGPVLGLNAKNSAKGTAFDWTTGTVYIYNKLTGQGAPGNNKFTSAGYDHRSAAGNGRIQLVSASLQRLYPTDGSNPPEGSETNRGRLRMTFAAQPALPFASPAALMTLGSLVLLSAGFAVSRKRHD